MAFREGPTVVCGPSLQIILAYVDMIGLNGPTPSLRPKTGMTPTPSYPTGIVEVHPRNESHLGDHDPGVQDYNSFLYSQENRVTCKTGLERESTV